MVIFAAVFSSAFPPFAAKAKSRPGNKRPVAGNAFVCTLRSSLRRALPLDGLMLQAVWGLRKAVIQLFYVIYSLCDVPMHFLHHYTFFVYIGNTAQFPPDGLSTAPAAAARHLRC
ncbi:hypothetical protein, partial [uncultured Gemmiger sp.]|uniref:hypothetical protein n=1 Tax=uncultured Gemmiger sp. TaxID=1623490 RepID=UPI0025F5352A